MRRHNFLCVINLFHPFHHIFTALHQNCHNHQHCHYHEITSSAFSCSMNCSCEKYPEADFPLNSNLVGSAFNNAGRNHVAVAPRPRLVGWTCADEKDQLGRRWINWDEIFRCSVIWTRRRGRSWATQVFLQPATRSRWDQFSEIWSNKQTNKHTEGKSRWDRFSMIQSWITNQSIQKNKQTKSRQPGTSGTEFKVWDKI